MPKFGMKLSQVTAEGLWNGTGNKSSVKSKLKPDELSIVKPKAPVELER
jgi:hypothetical protein